jgi:hypothetical protein
VSDVTGILTALKQGDTKANDELLPLVYNGLRHTAAQKMPAERPGHTLQPTALVHEAGSSFSISRLNPEKSLEKGSLVLLFRLVSPFRVQWRMYGR